MARSRFPTWLKVAWGTAGYLELMVLVLTWGDMRWDPDIEGALLGFILWNLFLGIWRDSIACVLIALIPTLIWWVVLRRKQAVP